MPGLTQALAQYVAKPGFGSSEAKALAVAQTGFLDTIATMIAGAKEPVVAVLLKRYAQADMPAESPVPFAGWMRPAIEAACINAAAAHALDYDDVALSGHPSTVLVPAILAAGHALNVSGKEALRAYVVGYEVWAELVFRETGQLHIKGWHPTGVLGTVAVAAAVSYLNKLDAETASRALAIAASMASGLVANFGTMTKPYHAGRAAANGIEAVTMAKLGLSASPDVFEHPAGYLKALSVKGEVDVTSAASRLGGDPRILETGLCIKRYPVCYSCHRTIDGVLKLAEEANIKADDVKRVHVTIGRAQASMLRNHHPRTGLEAKFSIEFAVASALVARDVGLQQLTDEFVNLPDVSKHFSKIEVSINDKPCPVEPSFSFTDRVQLELNDGRTLDSGDIRFPFGSANNPLDAAGMKQKFMGCMQAGREAGTVLPCSDADLYQRIMSLQDLPSVQVLFGKS